MRMTLILGSFVLALAVTPRDVMASPESKTLRGPRAATPTTPGAHLAPRAETRTRVLTPAQDIHGDDTLVPLLKQKCKKCKCKTCEQRRGYKKRKYKCKKCKCKKCDIGGKHECKKCKCKKCKYRGDKYKCKKCKCKKC